MAIPQPRAESTIYPLSRSYTLSCSSSSSGPVLASNGTLPLTQFFTSSSTSSSSRMSSTVPSPSSGAVLLPSDGASYPGQSASVQEQSTKNCRCEEPSWKISINCTCAPQTHQNAFKCSYHRTLRNDRVQIQNCQQQLLDQSQRLKRQRRQEQILFRRVDLRKAAIKNLLVKKAEAEGHEMKKRVALLIQSSSIHEFQCWKVLKPRSSRLSIMSNAQEG